jgi:hypothetical protein
MIAVGTGGGCGASGPVFSLAGAKSKTLHRVHPKLCIQERSRLIVDDNSAAYASGYIFFTAGRMTAPR